MALLRRQEGFSLARAGSLRVGCDPLHRHLLPPLLPLRSSWEPLERWCALLRGGELDAALISVAGLVSAAEHGHLQLPEASGLEVAALGSRPLVLVHASRQLQIAQQSSQACWQLLLPPAAEQPLLWRQLEQLGLLPLQECAAADSSSWLARLQNKPFLLPAHFSLLAAPQWRQAALWAVPAPELLQESLWLLLRQGESEQERFKALQTFLRGRIRLEAAEQI